MEEDKEFDNGVKPKEVILPDNYIYYPTRWHKVLLVYFCIILMFIPLTFCKKVLWGYKVCGKKNLKKHPKGNIIVLNHVLQQDCLCVATLCYFNRFYVTTLQSNMGFGLVSKFFRAGWAVPIPTNPRQFIKFSKETKEKIEKGKNIVIYPEAKLVPYCDHIRDFKPGAFHFAYQSEATIIPLCITFHKPKGLYRLYKKKPCIHMNVLEPYKIEKGPSKKEGIEKVEKDIREIMTNFFNEHNEVSYKKYEPKKKISQK